MQNRKKLVIGSLLLGGLACGASLVAGNRRANAAQAGPAHFVMLSCSTESDRFSVLSSTSTNPALRIESKATCTEALKAIVESGHQIVDVEYSDGGGRVIYTAVTANWAQDFNRTRSNKER